MSEFKYLVNPTDKEYVFQFDSIEYRVPAKSRKLCLRDVADHGVKRSIFLTDPVIGVDGDVVSPGNDVMQICYAEDADVISPVNYHEPILIEKNKEKVDNAQALSIDPSKPIKKSPGRPKKEVVESLNENA